MSTFSHSAPIYTKKNEQEEKSSTDEKCSALNDIYGINLEYDEETNSDESDADDDDDLDEDSDITDELLDEFQISLDNLLVTLDAKDTEAYERAFQAVPSVVARESNPKYFLRSLEYDPVKAARQLISYWDIRLKVFGTHGLMPMTIAGAMSTSVQDMVLMPNYLRWLPPDDLGRHVFCVDRTHIMHKDYDQMIFAKLFFFVLQLGISTNITIQKKGIIILVINRFASAYGYDDLKRKYVGLIVENMIAKGFPIKVKCVHFCFTSMALTIQVPIVKFFMSSHLRQRLIVHTSSNNAEVLHELGMYGMKRNDLPESLGGFYKQTAPHIIECQNIMKSRRRRQKRDRQRYERRQLSGCY